MKHSEHKYMYIDMAYIKDLFNLRFMKCIGKLKLNLFYKSVKNVQRLALKPPLLLCISYLP